MNLYWGRLLFSLPCDSNYLQICERSREAQGGIRKSVAAGVRGVRRQGPDFEYKISAIRLKQSHRLLKRKAVGEPARETHLTQSD